MDFWNLCSSIYAFVSLDSPSKGLASMDEITDGMASHLKDSLLFIGGSYSQFLGFEITSLYIYHTADISQISAYSAIISFTGIIFGLGFAISSATRTRINILLGKRLNRAAKHFYIFMLISLVLTGLVISLLCLLFRHQIIDILVGSDEQVSYYFYQLLLVDIVALWSDLQMATTQVAIKSIHRLGFLIKANFVLMIGCNVLANYLIAIVGGYGCVQIFICTFFWIHVLDACMFTVLFKSDWSEALPPVVDNSLELK